MSSRGSHAWAVALLLAGGSALADEPTVPVALQMDLLTKVAAYDRNLPLRAGDRVLTLVLVKAGHDESSRAGTQALRALKEREAIAGLPHVVESLAFTTADALAAACQSKKASIVYVGPGFTEAEIAAMGQKLDGLSVLTATGLPSQVGKGIVLGFDLVSGKPKLLVALGQAERQKVSLSANILKLMTVLP